MSAKDVTTISRVGILCAMRGEAEPIIRLGGLKQIPELDPDLPVRCYEGQIGAATVLLAVNGVDSRFQVDQIGTSAAAISAYLLVSKFRPDVLINAGTAGGIRANGASVGDIYVAQGNVHLHDRFIPISQYAEYAVGGYPTMPVGRVLSDLSLKKGVVSTSNSFGYTDEVLKRLIEAGTTVVEMEAAAIGWVAWEKKVPFVPVKGVSDLIDVKHSLEEQFNSNFQSVTQAVATTVVEIIGNIAGKSPADLAD